MGLMRTKEKDDGIQCWSNSTLGIFTIRITDRDAARDYLLDKVTPTLISSAIDRFIRRLKKYDGYIGKNKDGTASLEILSDEIDYQYFRIFSVCLGKLEVGLDKNMISISANSLEGEESIKELLQEMRSYLQRLYDRQKEQTLEKKPSTDSRSKL